MVDVRDATPSYEVLGEGTAASLLHRGGNDHLMGGESRRTVPDPSGDPVGLLRRPGPRQRVVDRAFAPDAAERIPEQVHLYREPNALNPSFPRDALMPGLRRAVVPVGDLGGFDILTCVTAGEHDQMLTFDTVSEVAELVPSADSAIHAGDVHAQMIEDPDGFLDLVGAWLHKHD